jgi:hypothetical protein
LNSRHNTDDIIKVGGDKGASSLKRRYKFGYVIEVQIAGETSRCFFCFPEASQPALRDIKVNAVALTFDLKDRDVVEHRKCRLAISQIILIHNEHQLLFPSAHSLSPTVPSLHPTVL